ncbi:flagellar hook-basal body complex protein FliE [Roseovarius sp. MBR-78]|jgi:flagellar hook-basal body complex protein FliE|uniref:flagellar hook-basal body complex protein FliE n=1 Tax=Roseovarius sp. MBR-78 TaxID=3156460 RepID=UPI00339883A8
MDMTTLTALQGYSGLRGATRSEPAEQTAPGLAALARDFAATLQEGEDTAIAAMTGEADPHALVQALVQTELAVETAVTVRDRVVEAYQEILRMPV